MDFKFLTELDEENRWIREYIGTIVLSSSRNIHNIERHLMSDLCSLWLGDNIQIIYYFRNKEDAMFFKLTWC